MNETSTLVCEICKRECKNLLSLSAHIRQFHRISIKDYYDTYLKGPSEGICPVTGKPTKFLGLRTGYQKYYSNKAAAQSKEVQKKYKRTCQNHYGTDHPFQSKIVQEKYKVTCLKKYNVENACQIKEVLKKREQTNIKKYGTKCPLQNFVVQEKSKQTMVKKYGVKFTLQSPELRQKYQQTSLQRYGTKHPFQNLEVQNRYKETCTKHFGVKNPFQSEIIRKQIKQTNLQKYGVENPSQNKSIRKKSQQTYLDNFGTDNPMKSIEIQKRFQQTCLERYGVPNPTQNSHIKQKISKTLSERFLPKLNIWLSELDLELVDGQYRYAHYQHQWKCLKCQHVFTQTWFNIYQGYRCPICYPRQAGISRHEQELANFLDTLELEVIRNDRHLIKPQELDIVIPSHKLAIEFDGLYWHSEQVGINSKYHLEKTKACESKGYQLIHIFEDEWILKKDIVKSRLKHIFGKTEDLVHIGARQCIIREITSEQKNNFLEKYHIQGKDSSKIKLGAFYNDRLVAVMTFSRGSISKGIKKQDPLVWELNRFCTHSDFVIPGIASKLLQYFKKNYKWKEIFSYADRRWSTGNLYKKLGFTLDYCTQPNYWYIKDIKRIHRFALRKRPDEPKDIPEFILRIKEGYVRVWDCGNLKFALNKNNTNQKGDQICLQDSM